MTTSTVETVSAAYVRAWGAGKGYAVGARGRISAELAAAFNKAHRSKQYGAGA